MVCKNLNKNQYLHLKKNSTNIIRRVSFCRTIVRMRLVFIDLWSVGSIDIYFFQEFFRVVMRHRKGDFYLKGYMRKFLLEFPGKLSQCIDGNCRFFESRSNNTEEKWGEFMINLFGVGILWMYRGNHDPPVRANRPSLL